MDEDVVWLYKVYDVTKISSEELEKELESWSDWITPHEVVGMNSNLLIIRYQSMLNRQGYFEEKARQLLKGKNANSYELGS